MSQPLATKVNTPLSENVQILKYSRVLSGRWGGATLGGGATRVAPPTSNFIGLYGKSYCCRPEHVHSFAYDFVKLIWPYYRNIMC